VVLDGFAKGKTAGAGEHSGKLLIQDLLPGDRMLTIEHPCGAARTGKIPVARGELVRRTIKLWVPDSKVTLADGTVKYGVLMEQNDHGDIVLAETPKRYERYLKPQFSRLVTLSPAEARECYEGLSGQSKTTRADKEDGPAPPKGKDEDEMNWGDDEEDAPDAEKGKEPDENNAPAGEAIVITEKDLRLMFKQRSNTDINKHFKGRRVTINGIPSASGKDGLGGYVAFGRHVRCFIDRDVYEANKEKIKAAIDAETPIVVDGVSPGMRGNTLVLRKSTLAMNTKDEK